MQQIFPSLGDASLAVLNTANAIEKAEIAQIAANQWFDGLIPQIGHVNLPIRPNRPDQPELRLPREMPKRKINRGIAGRITLLHALAHIELNAIDLAFDIISRFPNTHMPRGFYDDWVRVGMDEARHFLMLEKRLNDLGASYGDHPAHDGLWLAAEETSDSFLARLAIVPMVLEARGLDVTPAMIAKLQEVEDFDSADLLQIIHDDEITHVAAGKRWYSHLCAQDNLDEESTWQDLVAQFFNGQLKRPFNYDSRDRAEFPRSFYDPIAID